ncbi:tetratricopeptide repeat protein [Candidatus Neomarinimicrobiota bacterium]
MQKQRKRFTRKELKRDPLMEYIYQARQLWNQYRVVATRYGGIALAIIVITILVSRWRSGQDQDAAAVVGIAFVEYSHQNFDSVVEQLSPHVENYSGLPSFGGGLYILARSELAVGDTGNAEAYFRQYLKDYSDDDLLRSGAYGGLGTILENRGDYIEASNLFSKASKYSTSKSLRYRYILSTARNYVLAGREADALKLIQPLIDNEEVDLPIRNEFQILATFAKEKIKRSEG